MGSDAAEIPTITVIEVLQQMTAETIALAHRDISMFFLTSFITDWFSNLYTMNMVQLLFTKCFLKWKIVRTVTERKKHSDRNSDTDNVH